MKKKQNGKMAKAPRKKSVFKGGHPKLRTMKKCFFGKKLPDTICVRKGEKRIFVHTICFVLQKFFWTQTGKPGKTIKIVV